MIEKNAKSVIIILVAIIVFLITHKYGSDNEIVSHVGFAGTLISIILAVIAIIYTFYQSSMYQSSTMKLDQSAEKIKELTNKIELNINTLSEDVKSVGELRNVVKTFEHSVDNFNEMASSINTGVVMVNRKIDVLGNAYFDNLKTSNLSNSTHSHVEYSYSLEHTIEIISGLHPIQIANLYYILLAKTKDINVNFVHFNFWILGKNEHNDERDREILDSIHFIYGTMSIFTRIGAVELEFINTNEHEVYSISQVFSEALIVAIRNLKNSGEKENESLVYKVEEYCEQ
jgi:uncharacterized membrane protein YciS (DUF1049 family)